MTTATVIGVLGASGGVGASVLAGALAVRADAAGRPSVCVDGVRHGGGLDVAFGLEQEEGLRWPDLAGVRGRVTGAELCARLPGAEPTGVPVLAFDRHRDVALAAEPARRVVDALSDCRDVVVIDLPPPEGGLFDVLAGCCAHLVLVCGSGVRDLAAASAVAPVACAACAETWLTLRVGGGAGDLVEVVGTALDLPVLTLLADDPLVAADLAQGLPPGHGGRGHLAGAADRILADLLEAGERAS